MKNRKHILFGMVALSCLGTALGQEEKKSSYAPVVPKEEFAATMARMKMEKPAVMKRQKDLLLERYDLRNDAAPNVTMARGKPVQRGIRVKPAPGTSWEKLAARWVPCYWHGMQLSCCVFPSHNSNPSDRNLLPCDRETLTIVWNCQ